MLVHAGEIFFVFAVGILGAGWPIADAFRGSPLERLCALVGCSLVLLYLTHFTLFALGIPAGSAVAVTAVCGVLLARRSGELIVLTRDPEVRRALAAFGLITAFGFAQLALIHNFTGGCWAGDWLEHYQRAEFFRTRSSPATDFLGGRYVLAARPPLMNVLSASLLAQVGDSFAEYQVAQLLLNALVVLPMALLFGAFAPAGRWTFAALVAFAMANPSFAHNLAYGWTRHLTNFWVLCGIYAYATAMTSAQAERYAIAFAAFFAGVVTHYSAAPYLVVFAIHFAAFVLPRGAVSWRHCFAITLAGSILLGSWVGWSILTYGVSSTFGSNTTVTASTGHSGREWLGWLLSNLTNTLVPHFLRGVDLSSVAQRDPAGFVKDWWFLVFQMNLPLALGTCGWVLLLRESSVTDSPKKPFWCGMVCAVVVVGIAATNGLDMIGVAHACLQPLILLGIAFLAARFPSWPRAWRRVAVVGLIADFVLGVLLLLHFENMIPDTASYADHRWSPATYGNWIVKHQAGVSFFADRLDLDGAWVLAGISLVLAVLLRRMASTIPLDGAHP